MSINYKPKRRMPDPKRIRANAIDRFWDTVPPLWGRIRARIRASATADFGISVEQFHVLRYVRRGKKSASELADALNISRPAISQAVEVLVQKGLLTRTQSRTDRRYVELALTPDGSELLDALFERTRAWMAERMSGLTPRELRLITEAMGALHKMLEETATRCANETCSTLGSFFVLSDPTGGGAWRR